MAFSCNKFTPTLLVSFLILFHVSPLTRADIVDDACASAENADFCKTALRSDARAAGADLATLAQIGIDKTGSNVNSAVALVKSLLAGAGVMDPSMKEKYQTCLDVYNDASRVVHQCPGALGSKDYNSLNTYASAVQTDVDTCGDGFSGEPDELKQAGQKVDSLAHVILYASNGLSGQLSSLL